MPIRPVARLLITVYVHCCTVRHLRAERACLIVKRRLMLRRPGNLRTIALIDAFLEISFPRALKRRHT